MRKVDDAELLRLYDDGRGMRRIDLSRHFGCSPSYITKRLKELIPEPLPEMFASLSQEDRRFALSMAEGKSKTASALDAYECGSVGTAKVKGCLVSKREDIQLAIEEILLQEGMGRRRRIQRLKDHMEQDKDRTASLKSIDIANKMDGVYVEKSVSVEVDYNELVRDLAEIQSTREKMETELLEDYKVEMRSQFPEASEERIEQMAEKLLHVTCPRSPELERLRTEVIDIQAEEG